MNYFGEYVKTIMNVPGVIGVGDPGYLEPSLADEGYCFYIPVSYGDYDCYVKWSEDLQRPLSMAMVKSDYTGSNFERRKKVLQHSNDGENWKDCIVWVDLACVAMVAHRGQASEFTDDPFLEVKGFEDIYPEEDSFECMSGYGDGAYPIYYWQDKHKDIVALQVKFIEDNLDLVHGTDTVPFEKVLEVFNKK